VVEIIGVYPINPDVHLIELKLDNKPSEINLDDFRQRIPNVPRENWQAAYDEHFLNETGNQVIGDFFKKPLEDKPPTRLIFFLYFVNFEAALKTPFGDIVLPSPAPLPQRLKDIIVFEDAD
jgi:hypothetical protein